MPENNQQDISYQPSKDSYTFSTKSPPPNPKKILSTIFTLVVGIFGFIVLFFAVLGVLNYFNIISLIPYAPTLSQKLPKLTPAPTPVYDITNHNFQIEGTLYQYNDYLIKVKYYNKVISFKFDPSQSFFYTQKGQNSKIPGFFSDLEQQENIGKNVKVIYINGKDNVSIIQALTLIN